jgi:hypothetical protein
MAAVAACACLIRIAPSCHDSALRASSRPIYAVTWSVTAPGVSLEAAFGSSLSCTLDARCAFRLGAAEVGHVQGYGASMHIKELNGAVSHPQTTL